MCVGGGDGRPTTTPHPQSVEVQGGRIKSSGSGSLGLNHPQCLNIYCPTSPGGTGQRRALGRLGPSVFRLSNVKILMLDAGNPTRVRIKAQSRTNWINLAEVWTLGESVSTSTLKTSTSSDGISSGQRSRRTEAS